MITHQFTGADKGQQLAQRDLQRQPVPQILMAQAVDYHRLLAQAGGGQHPQGECLSSQQPVALDAHRTDGDYLRPLGIQAGGLEIQRHPLIGRGVTKQRGKVPVAKGAAVPASTPAVPGRHCRSRKWTPSHC
ncbi:hypothetical protein D3C85_1410760 [compost metagenome]